MISLTNITICVSIYITGVYISLFYDNIKGQYEQLRPTQCPFFLTISQRKESKHNMISMSCTAD